QREPLALLGERTRRRRQPFALRERALQRREPVLEQAHALGECLTLCANTPVEHAPRPFELAAKPAEQSLGRLAPQPDTLAGASEPVERRRRRLALAGRICQLLLDAVPLLEQRLETRVDIAPRERHRTLAGVALRTTLVDRRELQLRDPGVETRELAAQP